MVPLRAVAGIVSGERDDGEEVAKPSGVELSAARLAESLDRVLVAGLE